MECAAILDVLAMSDGCTREQIGKGKDLLFRIVAMLSKMTEINGRGVHEAEADYDYEHEHEHDAKSGG